MHFGQNAKEGAIAPYATGCYIHNYMTRSLDLAMVSTGTLETLISCTL